LTWAEASDALLFVYIKTCSFFKPLAPKLSSAFFGETKATALSWACLAQQTDVRQETTGNSKGREAPGNSKNRFVTVQWFGSLTIAGSIIRSF
jgi:hypothetical protein